MGSLPMFSLSLRETVDRYGLMAQKSLGQNFLLDQNITDKIIRLSLEKQGLKDFSARSVFEIGPGPGGLTRAVLNKMPLQTAVVEADPRCVRIMEDLRAEVSTPFAVIEGDALKIPCPFKDDTPIQIVSNLPYHISVPLLTNWLKQMPFYEAMTLMFQKEVADRIMAPVQTKSYGRLSVLAQLICRIDRLTDLNPECFVPAPKIWSSVLLFRPKDEIPPSALIEKVEKLTNAAFSRRRKMIRQSLKEWPIALSACAQLKIETTRRAEEISPTEYAQIATFL